MSPLNVPPPPLPAPPPPNAAALDKSQAAGEAGDVDVAMQLTQEAESLKQQHDRLHKTLTQPERTMTVCDICGVFINSTDNEQRRKVSNQVRPRFRSERVCVPQPLPVMQRVPQPLPVIQPGR